MKQPLKNLISLLLGDIGSRVLGFMIIVYLARVLESSAFGVINIGSSVLGYLFLLASPGIQVLEARNAAAENGTNGSRVNTILSLRLLLSVALLIVTGIVSVVLINATPVRVSIILFCLSLIPLSLFLDWFFQGKEHFLAVGIARLVSYLVYGAVVITTVRSVDDVLWVPIGFAIGNTAASLLLLILYRRFGEFTFVWQPSEWKSVLTSNVPVGLSVFLAQSAMNLPPIAVGWLVSTADAGMFSAALKIIFVLLMLDRILNVLFLPVATRYLSSQKGDAAFLVSVVMKFVLVIILPMTVCSVALSPPIISFVFGAAYGEAITLLQILMGYFFLTLINSLFVCVLLGAGRERDYTFALNIGSLMFVVGILFGTIVLGTRGAAIGVVVGEFCTVVLMWWQAKKAVVFPLWKAIVRPLIAGCVMVGAISLLREQSELLQAVTSLAAFVVAVFVLRGIDEKEMRFLRERFV